jgi:DNA-binding NarL/FixJ family response regulator
MTSRVVLADDHRLLRDGLRALIQSLSSAAEVVAEASDVAETIRCVREHRPDVLVLDLKMPGGQPIQIIRDLLAEHPKLRILIVTMYDDPPFLRSVLAAGAHGYLLKRSAYSDFEEALQSVLAGRLYVDKSMRMDVEGGSLVQAPRSAGTLTAREREVLVLLARGFTYTEVGKRLHIGARTVETHRRKVLNKLSLETRADLLRFALEFGLLSPGDVDSLDG